MKAMILAGGEGTRLRPLTLERPKPMVPLFGRPVLEHILLLLRRHGIHEVGVTLRYLPQVVTDYFGDGGEWGMHLTYFQEERPLGTAGGVKAAEAFLGAEDFLVISGDCVCDLDLGRCMAFHREKGAEATLVLHREREVLEYGLVQLSEDGRVQRFLEKPGWGQVFTNLVNTGIYLLSPAVLREIPAGENADFSRDVFPKLLSEGRGLYGVAPYGYWKDMGDCRAYLQAAADALDGKVKLDLAQPQVRGGIWSGSPIPDSAILVPPCWIGEGVDIGEQALIGPHTVLERRSAVGARSVAQRTVLLSGWAEHHVTLHGAIVCENARVGAGSVLAEGSVVGADTVVGENTILREEVRLWPRLQVEPGSKLIASVTGEGTVSSAAFEFGAIRGTLSVDITPELALTLGNLLGQEGRVGLGAAGGAGAGALLMAAAGGVSAAGGTPVLHDGGTWDGAVWFAGQNALPRSLFILQTGERAQLWVLDRYGLPLPQRQQRRLESALRRHEILRSGAGGMGEQENRRGVDRDFCAAAVRHAGAGIIRPIRVCVPEVDGENELLAGALALLGCRVLRQKEEGAAAFWTTGAGRHLNAVDEAGRQLLPEQLQVLAARLLLEGGETALALPWDAPAAAEALCRSMGAQILRPEDEGYRPTAWRQLPLRSGVFAACLICRRLGRCGERLAQLAETLPPFGLCRRELALRGDRGGLMEAVRKAWPDCSSAGDGVRLHLSGGWAWLVPAAAKQAVRIRTESESVELAAELCDHITARARDLDQL